MILGHACTYTCTQPKRTPSPTHTHTHTQVEKTKKKNRNMLLSRLKNRNKTVPSLDTDGAVDPENKQPAHLVSRNTWTAAELETVLPPTDTEGHTHSSSPTLEQRQKDITGTLPELPKSKAIKLPPIKRE